MILSNRQRRKLIEAGFSLFGDGGDYCSVMNSVMNEVKATDLGKWVTVYTRLTGGLVPSKSGGFEYPKLEEFDRGVTVVQLLFVFVETRYGKEVFVASPTLADDPVLKKLGLEKTDTVYHFRVDVDNLLARMSGNLHHCSSPEL